MALVTCQDCKQQVSSNAITCPHCGRSLPGGNFFLELLVAVLFLITGAGLIGSLIYGWGADSWYSVYSGLALVVIFVAARLKNRKRVTCNRLRWNRTGANLREALFLGIISIKEMERGSELGKLIGELKEKRLAENRKRRKLSEGMPVEES